MFAAIYVAIGCIAGVSILITLGKLLYKKRYGECLHDNQTKYASNKTPLQYFDTYQYFTIAEYLE